MSTEAIQWSESVLRIAGEFAYNYRIDEENRDEIYALWLYFNNSKEFEELNPYFSLDKSIMLIGNVGTGKTLLMRIFQRYLLLQTGKTYAYKHINHLANEYIETGFETIQRFDNKHLWIDEIGLLDKENVKRYGNTANLVEEVIMHRYERFVFAGFKTHITTNLTVSQIEQEYGSRIWSRLKEMCNMIPLTGKDRRDYARPRPQKNEFKAEKEQISEKEISKSMAEGIIEHYELCKKEKKYVACGVHNMLAHIYYDFLDKNGIINYTNEEKWKALETAKNINALQEQTQSIKNLLKKQLQSNLGNINTAKALLYQDFIMSNNVPHKLSKFL